MKAIAPSKYSLPIAPENAEGLRLMVDLNLRVHNYHTREILLKHIEALYDELMVARRKARESADSQKQRFYNVVTKCPKYSQLVTLEDDGKKLIFKITLSASYETVLREVLAVDPGNKVTAYLDNQDVVLANSQLPTVLLEALPGKRLIEVVELPAHYAHDGGPNPATITKVFNRMNQVVLRTSLWSCPVFGSTLGETRDLNKLDTETIRQDFDL